jgi:hypothetical protein
VSISKFFDVAVTPLFVHVPTILLAAATIGAISTAGPARRRRHRVGPGTVRIVAGRGDPDGRSRI